MSRLVIAEKPSVAQNIASVLKATNRKDGYLGGPADPAGEMAVFGGRR